MADKPLTYGTYLRVPQLLELQKSLSSPAHHDEALFIIIHQVYELWFKLILHEVDSAAGEIEEDHVYEGTRLLRRVVEIQRLLIHQVRILETMRPQAFLGFRYHLNPASGFQSIQFREIEFMLGLKNPAILDRHVCDDTERQRLEARLAAPSVSDVFDALLVTSLGAGACRTAVSGVEEGSPSRLSASTRSGEVRGPSPCARCSSRRRAPVLRCAPRWWSDDRSLRLGGSAARLPGVHLLKRASWTV